MRIFGCSKGLVSAMMLMGVGLLVDAGLSPSISEPAKGDPVVIGVIEDRSGGATFYSQEGVKGAKLFADLMNQDEFLFLAKKIGSKPGIMGRPVKLIFEDDEGNANLTPLKTRRLLESGAQTILFLSGSASALQGRVVCAEQKIVCIAPTNTSGRITQPPGHEYVFTVMPDGGLSAKTYIDAWNKLGYKKIATIIDNTATAKIIADVYASVFAKAGFEIVAKEVIEPGARDANSQVLRIKDANPDAIFSLIQSATEAAAFHKSIERLGVKIPRWGTVSDTSQPKSWELAGSAINGLIVVDAIAPDNPNTQSLSAAYTKRYGANAVLLSLHSTIWDAMMLIKMAAENAGGLDGVKMRDYIESVKDFPSSLGQKGHVLSFSSEKHTGSNADGLLILEFANAKPSKVWEGKSK